MSKTVSPAPPPLDLDRSGLFLDYDGTLVELAPTPAEATADGELRDLLAQLQLRLGGALAVVTGRPVEDVDGFLAPLRLTVAGLHGLVLRRQDGSHCEARLPPGLLDPAREAFATFAAGRPGTLVEDKRLSVALHYRQAPAEAEAADALAQHLNKASGGALKLQRGKMVVELLPAGSDKGSAIVELLDEAAFSGRSPVFIGDDVTDEIGFQRVNERGGISVRIGGEASKARYGLPDVTAMRHWLRQAAAF